MILRLLAKSLLLPPLAQLLGLLLSACLWQKYRKLAIVLGVTSFASLWLMSTPLVSRVLIGTLENRHPPIDLARLATDPPDAIVILAGGRISQAPDLAGVDTLADSTLTRVRYGAYLYRQQAIPILVSGGVVFTNAEGDESKSVEADVVKPVSLAELMRRVLEEEFRVPVTWLESQSKTTFENAQRSFEILAADERHRIALVTDASHMPRSVAIFKQAGFEVVPAPTAYESSGTMPLWEGLLPTTQALDMSYRAAHEWLGYWVYRVIY